MQLRRSPFKVDKIEDDPNAYGIRIHEIHSSVESLFDDRNVLITGPRGIGKSSLAKQMQILYEGNYTLLERCRIMASFPMYLCTFYACDENSTLATLTRDLLFRIEGRLSWLETLKAGSKKKLTAGVDLGFFRANLETDIISSRPASIVTQFIEGVKMAYNCIKERTDFEGISILIDEIDRLPTDINFGHFLKLIHEYSDHEGLSEMNYILAGQRGIYRRRLEEDPSIERLFTHVPISKIDSDQSSYILNYAGSKAEPAFGIEETAQNIILKLSAGFPWVIHLLGDRAFHQMDMPDYMSRDDVLEGLRNILKNEKHEKYLFNISSLSKDERIIIATLANYSSDELPMKIPIDWVKEYLVAKLGDESDFDQLLFGLAEAGQIIVNKRENVCQFNDELFRVYLSLRYIEGSDRSPEKEERIDEVRFEDDQVGGVIGDINEASLDKEWEFDEFEDLMRF